MRKMTGWVILTVVVLLLGISIQAWAQRDEGMMPADGFFLPEGDPVAGREAFVTLKCMSCHWVANDTEFTGPVADKIGPLLGYRQAGYSAGWLANSIVTPSHTIAGGSNGLTEEGKLSRMGDFSEIMTVRQLIDIVAYLKSKGEQKPAAASPTV